MDDDERPVAKLFVPWDWDQIAIQALMKVCGDSVNKFARRIDASPRAVGYWVYEGATPTPALALQLYRVWAQLKPWQRKVFAALLTSASATTGAGWDVPSSTKEKYTNRRDAVLALLSAPFIPQELLERIMDAGGWGVDNGLVASHEQWHATLAAAYRTTHPRLLLPAVAGHADDVYDLLGGSLTPKLRTRLAIVGVGAHCEAGLLAFQLGDVASARRQVTVARDIAEEAADLSLQAQALGVSSMVWSPALRGGRGGDPERAVDLLDQALALERHLDGCTRGWLAVSRSSEAIEAKDLDTAQVWLEAGRQALAEEGPPDGLFSAAGMCYGTAGHLVSVEARADALAGRFDEAEHVLEQLVAGAVNVRIKATDLTHLGWVRMLAKQPEASDALKAALAAARSVGHVMGVERIRAVRDQFPGEWAGLGCVRELDELLNGISARTQKNGL